MYGPAGPRGRLDPVSVTVRPLTDDEIPAGYELGRVAFGGPPEVPAHLLQPIPGVTRWGAFDAAGRLVGKATDVGHEQWWGGRRVVAADVGGVAVSPEARGSGVARALLGALLAAGRDRGAAVSALYPTVAQVYRSLGWEVVGTRLAGTLDTASLPGAQVPAVTLRPGDPADVPLLTEVYEQVARGHNGLLTRRGGVHDQPPNNPLGEDVDALTVAETGGVVIGVLAIGRGLGYGPEATLQVEHLHATTADAARALVGVLAGWRTVARQVRIVFTTGDAVAAVLPTERATDVTLRPWMHRSVDVVRAIADRGWPAYVRGRVAFSLADDLAPWNAGDWQLSVADGRGELTRTDTAPDRWLSIRGFAALYSGAATGAGLAQAGLAGGFGDPGGLDLLGCGPPARLLDYF